MRPAANHGPWWSGGSPGIGGYVLAVVASAGVLALLFPVGTLLDEPVGYPVLVALVFAYGLAYSLPVAVPGCLLVHLVCLRVEAQWVHVLAAGVAGLLAGALAPARLFGGDWPWLGPLLGLATTIGRTAVVPLAGTRQHDPVPVPVP